MITFPKIRQPETVSKPNFLSFGVMHLFFWTEGLGNSWQTLQQQSSLEKHGHFVLPRISFFQSNFGGVMVAKYISVT